MQGTLLKRVLALSKVAFCGWVQKYNTPSTGVQWTPQPARNQKIFGPLGETPCLLGPLPVFISLELGAVAESYPCPKTGRMGPPRQGVVSWCQ